MSKEIPTQNPLDQAYEEKPKRWYENQVFGNGLLFNSALVSSNIAYIAFIHNYSSLTRLAGASVYILSTIADRLSTYRALNSIKEAKDSGIEVIHKEQNPLLVSKENPLKLEKPTKIHVGNLIGLGLSTLTLGSAMPISAYQLVYAANNERINRRYRRAICIFSASQNRE